MTTLLVGTVTKGYGVAGTNLTPVLHLIEARSGLRGLLPNTLNIRLTDDFSVTADFTLSPQEYNGSEELRFQHCHLGDTPCLIMRPDTHEAGGWHGRKYLELMSNVWLRERLGLCNGSQVQVALP